MTGEAKVPEQVVLFETVTRENFREDDYIEANPRITLGIVGGHWKNALDHAEKLGFKEGRRQFCPHMLPAVAEMRKRKFERVQPLLVYDAMIRDDSVVDALSEDMRVQFNVVSTENVSAHTYGPPLLDLINRHAGGLVLDCGSGYRPIYYDNVVNYEIVDYPTTDVIGVAEKLPFKDNSFDAVISSAVLEHVRYPWLAGAEIVRVLKPGGELHAAAPMMSPLHGYPHHYFNMTHQGLAVLFEKGMRIDSQSVPPPLWPIHTLTKILRDWTNGLKGKTRQDFLDMKVRDLIGPGGAYFKQPFCTELSEEKRFELASGTLLKATKIG